jgi:hypothetical protein
MWTLSIALFLNKERPMGGGRLDTKTYRLTDRQSQRGFDFDFDQGSVFQSI